MANKPISMSKVKQIIRLYKQGVGKRKIAQRLAISKNTVKLYVEALLRQQQPLEELMELSDHDLNQLLHPPRQVALKPQIQQLYEFFPEMETQMRRRGMTVAMQYRAFREKYPNGYEETAFYKYYKIWKQKVNPVMHIEHKVGDKMYVDYAGDTLPYVEEDSGEIRQSQVFVSILGWSQYAYVEALRNQTTEEFITGCEHALQYFKGVPLAIVPDNLKSAVFKANRYEPELNENFKAFADHYGTTILPARARKPQDKAHVENLVKLTYQRVYTSLPEREIFTLTELNLRILGLLTLFNTLPLTGRPYSRRDQWMLEQPTLQPLAARPYEMRTIRQVTVMKNGHIVLTEDQHYYSVPYVLIGKKLKLQYSRSIVELYDQYTLVASHKRVRSAHTYTTEPMHMPPQHQYLTEWSPSFFLEKARAIDPAVEAFIREVLNKKHHPEQAYKSCQGILSFAKRVGSERLIKACRRAHEFGYFNYRAVEDILRRNLDSYEEPGNSPSSMPSHDNIRGGDYYR